MENITILGSTGSIGENTLSVIREHPDKFKVFALSANSQVDKLYAQCLEFKPMFAVLRDTHAAILLQEKMTNVKLKTQILSGVVALEMIASHKGVDQVMAAIVGIAGLRPAYAAVTSGKKVLLANKEALVTAGQIFMDAAHEYGATIIPVDSEHNAIFQCLPEKSRIYDAASVTEIILTASGGPFLRKSLSDLKEITPDEACAHPNWKMGRKISVDSSTMVNKALEMIEAYWLFAMPVEKLTVLIHPESIVHSMVRYQDGSFLAQIGSPDMRTPIAYSLFYPERGQALVKPLDLTEKPLNFIEVDTQRFPAIQLVYDMLSRNDIVGTIIFNAANEVLVNAFLNNQIKYLEIVEGIKKAVLELTFLTPQNIEDVIKIDQKVRKYMCEGVLA
jgi:1-deoxy-D-xylulose-5-phosphate reductoisomerase